MVKTDVILTLKIFCCWILILFLFYLLGIAFFGDFNRISIDSLANWDGRHFLDIAQNGYKNQIQYAFFPFYPLVINLTNKTFNIGFLYSALLVNIVSIFGSIYLFRRLTKLLGYKNFNKPLIYLLIFPTSFYLICVYSESLFLFLSLLTFFFAKQKKYLKASFFAMLCLITRINGLAVILGLIIDAIFSGVKLKEKFTLILISISGFLLYSLFLYFHTGNLFYFLISEQNWSRTIDIPGVSLWNAMFYIAHQGVRSENFTILSDLLFSIFGLGIGLRSLRFLKPSLTAYTLLSLIIPFMTSLILSMPRFLVIIFPLFMLIANTKVRIFKIGYIIVSLVFLFLYFNFFLRNIWVS